MAGKKGSSSGGMGRDHRRQLLEELRLLRQVERSFESLSSTASRSQRAVSTQISEAFRAISKMDHQVSDLTGGVLSRMQALTRHFEGFSSHLLNQAMDLVNNMISTIMSAFGGGGGGFWGFLGGLFSFLPFLQEGGLVRGTERGLPAVIGERFTDELIIPLDRLPEQMMQTSPSQIVINESPIHIDMTRSLVGGADLDRVVYEAAERGRRHSLKRLAEIIPSGGGD